MKILLKILAIIGLGLTVIPSFLVFYGVIDKSSHFNLMLIGAILWFVSAPFWMKSPKLEETEEN